MPNPWTGTGARMIVTTTDGVEGRRITAYHGVVVGEAILGANVLRDIFAGITDIIGGRSAAYEKSLGEARATALRELEARRSAILESIKGQGKLTEIDGMAKVETVSASIAAILDKAKR